MNITDFMVKGFTYCYDKNIINLIGDLPDCKHDNVWEHFDNDLTEAQEYVKRTYVTPMFGESKSMYNSIWKGTEQSVCVWHNDKPEGANLAFLYYLTTVEDRGEIRFRRELDETGCLKPEKHLLVMLSQNEKFEHKATDSDDLRIVINFGFEVDGLNY